MPKQPGTPGDRKILKAFAVNAPKGPAFAILAGLFAHVDANLIAWPGYGQIAALSGTSVRSVQRWIPKLETLGFFRRESMHTGSRRDGTRYHFGEFVDGISSGRVATEAIPPERRYRHTGGPVSPEWRARVAREATKETKEGNQEGDARASARGSVPFGDKSQPEFEAIVGFILDAKIRPSNRDQVHGAVRSRFGIELSDKQHWWIERQVNDRRSE